MLVTATSHTADAILFVEQFVNAVDFQDVVEDISPDTRLDSLPEWDSLAALGVIVMCDMEYGVTIVGNDLKNSVTVGDIYALVVARKAA
jgi:acyl carrier protein